MRISKLTRELALALEVASIQQAWEDPSPFQDKINELLVKAGRKPVALKERMPENIFSGDYSRDMWDEINKAKSVAQLRSALYLVCCRLQELESLLAKRAADVCCNCGHEVQFVRQGKWQCNNPECS